MIVRIRAAPFVLDDSASSSVIPHGRRLRSEDPTEKEILQGFADEMGSSENYLQASNHLKLHSCNSFDALKPRKPLIIGPGAGPGGIPISSLKRGVHNVNTAAA